MNRIAIGKIVAAHGVKGLVKILPLADDASLLDSDAAFYTSAEGPATLSITLKNPMGKYILASVEGVTERNGAEALRLTDLYIDKDTLPEIEDDGTYYHADLIGLKAVDENGVEVGVVTAVENYGAGDLLEIKPQGGKAFLMPFTPENFPDVDEDDGVIHIRNFEAFRDMV
jgi:16S rRNA processing protein RimM